MGQSGGMNEKRAGSSSSGVGTRATLDVDGRGIGNAEPCLDHLTQRGKLKALGCLAVSVAHDFNNLLTSVMSVSDMLEQQFYTEGRTHAK